MWERWLLALLLVWSEVALAQGATDGALHGMVLDAARRPAAGIVISLKGVDGAEERTGRTGRDGSFLLVHLTPGSYQLAIGVSGKTIIINAPVEIPLGETLELRAVLLIAGSAVQVVVSEPQPAATPLPDENGDGLATAQGLQPMQNGAVLDGASANQTYGAVPVGTGRDPAPDPDGNSDSAELTTGPANGMARGRHAGVAYVFAQSAVREFRVTGQNYSAQAGHAGDVSTTVSRSGTRDWHGSGFFALRSEALAASDPLAAATSYANGIVTAGEVKPHDLRQNFGMALAGPLWKRRAVTFFYAFDQQLRGFPAVSSPSDPNFYQLTAIQATLLQNRGVTPTELNSALNYISSLTGLTPRRADQQINFGRVDWHPRSNVGLAGEYNRVRWNSPAGLIDAPVVARGRASIGNATGSLDSILLRLSNRFPHHMSNEWRIAYVGDAQYESPQSPLAQEPAISPGGLAPEVNISPNGLLFGTPAALSQFAYPDEWRMQIGETLTLVQGRHLLEIGGEFSLVNDRVATLANAAGTFSYDSGATGGKAGGLVDFITDYTFNVHAYPNGGCPAIAAKVHLFCFRSFSQSFGESSISFPVQEWSGFVEDTWRPLRSLTVRAGLRYEYTLLPIPYTPNPSLDVLFGMRGATSIFPEDRNNLGPRAAISYEPFGAGRGIVRAGFGVFFGRVPGATIQAALSDTAQVGSTTRVRIRPSSETACPQAASQGFGYPCAFLAAPTGIAAATTSAMVFDRRFRLPVVEQGSLSVDRSILRRTTLTATYTLNLDRQLPGSTDLNILPATALATYQLQGGTGAPGVRDGETFQLPLYTSRVSPDFGPVTDIVSNVNASYNALAVALRLRPRPSLEAHAEYAWSKAIDFGQAQSATPRTDSQLDPFNHGYDKGLSSLNYPWSLRATVTWAPRLTEAPRWLRGLGDGWQLASILAAHSGRPYSFDLSGGTYLPGGHESLNGSGGALYLPTVGRNTLRLPAVENTNLRVDRRFRAGNRGWVRPSVEVFNAINQQNVSSVNQRAYLVGTASGGITPLVFQSKAEIAAEGLNTTAFGTPTATGTSLARARQVQFSVRIEF